jgi:hypothetical protein
VGLPTAEQPYLAQAGYVLQVKGWPVGERAGTVDGKPKGHDRFAVAGDLDGLGLLRTEATIASSGPLRADDPQRLGTAVVETIIDRILAIHQESREVLLPIIYCQRELRTIAMEISADRGESERPKKEKAQMIAEAKKHCRTRRGREEAYNGFHWVVLAFAFRTHQRIKAAKPKYSPAVKGVRNLMRLEGRSP